MCFDGLMVLIWHRGRLTVSAPKEAMGFSQVFCVIDRTPISGDIWAVWHSTGFCELGHVSQSKLWKKRKITLARPLFISDVGIRTNMTDSTCFCPIRCQNCLNVDKIGQ